LTFFGDYSILKNTISGGCQIKERIRRKMDIVKDTVLERNADNGFDLAREMQEAIGYNALKPEP
jgi:hypothetical protein